MRIYNNSFKYSTSLLWDTSNSCRNILPVYYEIPVTDVGDACFIDVVCTYLRILVSNTISISEYASVVLQ